MRAGISVLMFLGFASYALGQESLDGRDGRNLALDQFRPVPMLKVEEHHLPRAKFPVIDVHTHPRIRFHHSPEMLDDFVKLMDEQNIAVSTCSTTSCCPTMTLPNWSAMSL